ncbi:flagella assembly protein FlgT [Marinospirillum alkaliphilum]|uniref:Flagellar assembly protein T, N-terminal domain n=1 Tax=Marinospirillum alkaliphilum DSM 21637 TaxID=1122209 RepID=A0A1K1VIS3_9GAMM|nr:flagella assembly protein FlgT [Marinospirillum alkaliphilum]SFX24596.1 Flagellar assembly protein T, N-terminal domain [Marinospirillum alkaliphilum DSM 21637]
MHKAIILMLLLLLSLPLQATQWVEATGSAVIQHQDLTNARRAAIRDALRQASFQGALEINGYQAMSGGQIHTDQVAISTQSSILEMEVLNEKVERGLLFVTVRARVENTGSCEGGNYANGYRRSLAISNFYLERPWSANMGALHDVNERLPRELLQRMQGYDRLRVLDAVRYQLYNDTGSIPTSVSDRGTLTTAVDTATRIGSQYVLTGVVRSMDLLHPELASERPLLQGIYERTRYRGDRFARDFKVDLFIHDGFSGELVTSRSYNITGNWTENRTEKVGFGSPRFWETDYGRKVDDLIEQMVSDLHVMVGCQPFMARITRTDNKTLYIDAGSDAGLRPGDTLGVYRLNTFFDHTQRPYTELVPVDLTLSLRRVQPNFANGTLVTLPEMVNIQQGDLVIAW